MSERSPQEQQLLLARMTQLFEHQISFNELLGLRVQTLDPPPVAISFAMRPEFIGHFLHGRLHGGVISSVLDVTGGLSIMMGIAQRHGSESAEGVMQRFATLATIDMRVDYLRQGIGSQFSASAEVVRLGKRVGVTRASLSSDTGRLIATANASYIIS